MTQVIKTIDKKKTFVLLFDNQDLAASFDRFVPDYNYSNGKPMNDIIWVPQQNTRSINLLDVKDRKCVKIIQRTVAQTAKVITEVKVTLKSEQTIKI